MAGYMSNQVGELATFTSSDSDFQLQYLVLDGEPWFRGKDAAALLGYANTKQAIQTHVHDDDRKKLKEIRGLESRPPTSSNAENSIFINEAGLYSLILRSQKEEARTFQRWVTKEVLPAIRKTGSYTAPEAPALPVPTPSEPLALNLFDLSKIRVDNSINLYNEKELHIQVVNYIRRFHPEAIMMAGLGELQETVSQRVEGKMKGYQKGCCDLMILNKHMDYHGLCIELKNPRGTGRLGDEQLQWLTSMHLNGHNVLISNDYDEITRTIDQHFERVRLVCPHCVGKPRYFRNRDSLSVHLTKFHHNIKQDAS
jgi:prophage antirepressor-like protein